MSAEIKIENNCRVLHACTATVTAIVADVVVTAVTVFKVVVLI